MIIVTEETHNGQFSCWKGTEDEVISIAMGEGYELDLQEVGLEEAREEYDSSDSCYSELFEIIEQNGRAVVYSDRSGDLEFYKVGEITELEAARLAISRTIRSCSFYTIQEALELVNASKRWSKEEELIRNELVWMGEIDELEEEEEED